MNLIKIINEEINEVMSNDIWYHGSPDAREVKQNGFELRKGSVEYVTDIDKYKKVQAKLHDLHGTDEYFKLLDVVPTLKKEFTYNKPIFFTNNPTVARTYADPHRAFDYQNAEEKLFKIAFNNVGKLLTINAHGDRFRFINPEKVKQAFIAAGIPENDIVKTIESFNYYVTDNKGIKTDTIAAIAQWYNFDTVDVVGVYDSYHGGTIKSTVRMTFDPKNVKILNESFLM